MSVWDSIFGNNSGYGSIGGYGDINPVSQNTGLQNGFSQGMGGFGYGGQGANSLPNASDLFGGIDFKGMGDGYSSASWMDKLGGIEGIFDIANLAATGIFGSKQLSMAEDMMKQNQKQFGLNYDAQRNLINAELADRQRRRVRDPNSTNMSPEDYMAQYGIPERNSKKKATA